MSEKKEIRVRFAPSPTGELHIGGLRTALTDFLFAQKEGGKFILRIEDTDQKRYVEGSIPRIVKSLEWAGLTIDEGVVLDGERESKTYPGIFEKGECGPYIQSERKEIYDKYVKKLLDEGKAYYCFCSAERLEEMRNEQIKMKKAPKYDRKCVDISREEAEERVKNGEKCVVRFRVPEGETEFEDLVFGKVKVKNDEIDDQVIMKTDGFPTYHLAMVVDDYLMKISHVFRGAEWLPSTPKHVLLFEALGWKENMPKFVHMANILNKNKKKLSKREGSVSVQDFKNEGYPPEALVNFIALLGWNPKTEQEIFSMQELIDQFDVKKMNRAGGVFDLDRLNWISSQHIKNMNEEKLYEYTFPFLQEKEFFKNAPEERKTEEFVKKLLAIEKDRLEKFTQVGEENQFFFSEKVKVEKDDMRWKDMQDEEIKKALQRSLNVLENIEEENWTIDNITNLLLKEAGDNRGELLFPLRAAITGEKRSPSPFEVAWVLGKKETINRINKAIIEVF